MNTLVSWSWGKDSAWMVTTELAGDMVAAGLRVRITCPMFRQPVPVATGITVERDGFAFTDLALSDQLPNYSITRSPDTLTR